jgi:hypothetical protein
MSINVNAGKTRKQTSGERLTRREIAEHWTGKKQKHATITTADPST